MSVIKKFEKIIIPCGCCNKQLALQDDFYCRTKNNIQEDEF